MKMFTQDVLLVLNLWWYHGLLLLRAKKLCLQNFFTNACMQRVE